MSKFSNLIKLAKKGDIKKLTEQIEEGMNNINEIDTKSGRGLLHIAIENDDQELFSLLVKRPGIDIDLLTSEGESPLEMAVRLNNPDIVSKLLDLNVKCNKKNARGETVLHNALRHQTHRDILKRLTTKLFDINEPIDQFGSFLNLVVVSGQADNFYFLMKELSLDYTKRFDKEGNTCLILAVRYNRGDFVMAILEKLREDPLLTQIERQFFINHQNSDGNTALHEAVLKDLQTITQKLENLGKEFGIDLSIRNRKGQTFEQIKAFQQKERLDKIEMDKRRQEQRIVYKKEKSEQKLRQKAEEQRRQIQQLRMKKELQKKIEIEQKILAETQRKKTAWILGIIVVIILSVMYLSLTNAIEKKKPVTL